MYINICFAETNWLTDHLDKPLYSLLDNKHLMFHKFCEGGVVYKVQHVNIFMLNVLKYDIQYKLYNPDAQQDSSCFVDFHKWTCLYG